jgi:hypothetical protein
MILGRFYFKLTDSGNLVGEFSNNALGRVSTESADRIPALSVRNFVGDYNTTWLENGAELLALNISPKRNTNEMILSLVWRNGTNEPAFRGEGFIIDHMLIGNYWDVEVENEIGNRLQQP